MYKPSIVKGETGESLGLAATSLATGSVGDIVSRH